MSLAKKVLESMNEAGTTNVYKNRAGMRFAPFTKGDWGTYAGATEFANGDAPVIASGDWTDESGWDIIIAGGERPSQAQIEYVITDDEGEPTSFVKDFDSFQDAKVFTAGLSIYKSYDDAVSSLRKGGWEEL